MFYATPSTVWWKYSNTFTIASPTEPSKEAVTCSNVTKIIQFFVSTENYQFWRLQRYSTHAFN